MRADSFTRRFLGKSIVSTFPGLMLSVLAVAAPAEPLLLKVDFGKTNGHFRALHGINKGPIAAGGMVNVIEAQRTLQIPFTRLHDCHWPNPDVVDIHAIFPRPEADPHQAGSYDFALTDSYLSRIQDTGAKMIYRLGESIEHTRTKRFVHPPADVEHWAEICLGIIRHYTDGWENGFHFQIPYWEIWNEPENRPAMWSGSDEDYFRLYKTAARKIKSAYPGLKVGGPAVGYSGQFKNGQFEASAFVLAFLQMCRREHVPLDFFSWHCYTADPGEPGARAKAIRQLLDKHGFERTESHLNEWNYLPGNTWKPISKTGSPEERESFYAKMAGAGGAAFLATALIDLQDAPVDVCNLFHGELGGFGLFSENGVPYHNYYGLLAFRHLVDSAQRVWTEGGISGHVAVAAGIQPGTAVVMAANYDSEQENFHLEILNLPGSAGCSYTILRLDTLNKLVPAEKGDTQRDLTFRLKKPGVVLINLEPRKAKEK